MKIAGTGPVQTSPIRRRKRGDEAAGGDFAEQLSTTRSAAGPAPASPASKIDGLFLLQEVDEDGRGRREARERGEAILDQLDEIRTALLSGTLNTATLSGLLSRVREKKAQFEDPRLREILGEIELRAAVELAKFGRSA